MANNRRIGITNLTDNINLQRLRFNQLRDSVGDVSSLTTTDSNVVGAINEHDAELGTISAGAMGTIASTVSGAINELDGRLDSINNTEVLTPRITMTDSSATNISKGNFDTHGTLNVNGLTSLDSTTIEGSLVVEYPITSYRNLQVNAGGINVTGKPRFINVAAGDSAEFTGHVSIAGGLHVVGDHRVDGDIVVGGDIQIGDESADTISFKSEIKSNLNPNVHGIHDLGQHLKEWRNLWIAGDGNIDHLISDSATIASVDINSGKIDGTVIGDSAKAAGTFTQLSADSLTAGAALINGNTVITGGHLHVLDSAMVSGKLQVGELISQGDVIAQNVTTIGQSRIQNKYTVVQDGLVVDNANRGGLAVHRPGTDSAVIQWNEQFDHWEAGTSGSVNRLALQNESAAFNGLYVGGNLTVQGTQTILNTETMTIDDNIMVLNNNATGAPTENAGLEIERGQYNNAKLVWDETNNYWAAHTDSAAVVAGTLSRIATLNTIGVAENGGLAYNATTGKYKLDSAQLPNFFENVTLNNVNIASLSDSAIDIHSTHSDLTLRSTNGAVKLTSEYDIILEPDGQDVHIKRNDNGNYAGRLKIWNPGDPGSSTLAHGYIQFVGYDDAGNGSTSAQLGSFLWNAAHPNEDGRFELSVLADGSLQTRMRWDSTAVEFDNNARLMLGTSANASTLLIKNSSGTTLKTIIGTTQ